MPNSGGARPGAGRPPKELSERKRWLQERAIMDWTTEEDAREFWVAQMTAAKACEPSASKLVASYMFGVPTQPIEVSGPDRGPVVIRYVNDWRNPEAE